MIEPIMWGKNLVTKDNLDLKIEALKNNWFEESKNLTRIEQDDFYLKKYPKGIAYEIRMLIREDFLEKFEKIQEHYKYLLATPRVLNEEIPGAIIDLIISYQRGYYLPNRSELHSYERHGVCYIFKNLEKWFETGEVHS